MNHGASLLVRNADFVAFSKTGNTTSTSLCDVRIAKWVEQEEHLVFHITSNRFLRNMVRAIVGTLVEAGRGNIPPQRAEEILLSKQAPVSGFTVPARGLFLSDVQYPPEFQL
jgi:tRNA pseudouridine38-40 synthase